MSRIQARYYIEGREQEWAEASYSVGAKIRYSRRKDVFELKCLDVYEYANYGEAKTISVFIEEADLLRMIDVDKNYNKDDKNDFYYKKVLGEIEQCDLDDDTFNCVSVCQYFFNLSTRIVSVLVKRQEHLHRLKKVGSAFLELAHRQFHSKGGRPKGSKNKGKVGLFEVDVTKLSKEEADRIEYNRSIWNSAMQKYLVAGNVDAYKEMCKEAGIRFNYKEFCKKRLEIK